MKKIYFLLFLTILIAGGLFVFSDSAKAQCVATLYDNIGCSSSDTRLVIAQPGSNNLGVRNPDSAQVNSSGCTLRLYDNEGLAGRYIVLGYGLTTAINVDNTDVAVISPACTGVTLYDNEDSGGTETSVSSALFTGNCVALPRGEASSVRIMGTPGCTVRFYPNGVNCSSLGTRYATLGVGYSSSIPSINNAAESATLSCGTATIWENESQGGRYTTLGAGTSTALWFDGRANSVQPVSGCSITLWDGIDFSGTPTTRNYDATCPALSGTATSATSATVQAAAAIPTPTPTTCSQTFKVVDNTSCTTSCPAVSGATVICIDPLGNNTQCATNSSGNCSINLTQGTHYTCNAAKTGMNTSGGSGFNACNSAGITLTLSTSFSCTPTACDTSLRKYCQSNGTWTSVDDPLYCSNCSHCGDSATNCDEIGFNCGIIAGCAACGTACSWQNGSCGPIGTCVAGQRQQLCMPTGCTGGTCSSGNAQCINDSSCSGPSPTPGNNCSWQPANCGSPCTATQRQQICGPTGCTGGSCSPVGSTTCVGDPACNITPTPTPTGSGTPTPTGSGTPVPTGSGAPTPSSGPGGPSLINFPNPLNFGSIDKLIDNIIGFIFYLAIIIAPIIIIFGGFLFITAAGSSERINTAKRVILYAVIGLAIALFAKGLISVIKDIIGVN